MNTTAAAVVTEWITKAQAAAHAGVTTRTITQWEHDGDLRSVGSSGAWRTRAEWVDQCLERRTTRRRSS